MLRQVLYSADLAEDVTVNVTTHEGSTVIIHHRDVQESGMWNRTAKLVPRDELTKTGVVHELQDVLVPASLRVSMGDLVRAAGGNTMTTLINRAGLGGLLNGTLTMEDVDELDDWKRTHKRPNQTQFQSKPPPVGWTLLCPEDGAFKSVNLTRLLNDQEALRTLVLQHIIPMTPSMTPSSLNAELPLSYHDEARYTTLLSPSSLRADLVFRITGKPSVPEPRSEIIVGIHGARGASGEDDFARVINYGRTTVPDAALSGARSGVLQIDRVLQPWVPGWWDAWGWAVAGGAVGVALITGFWSTVMYFWWRKSEEATYEPLDGEVTGEDD